MLGRGNTLETPSAEVLGRGDEPLFTSTRRRKLLWPAVALVCGIVCCAFLLAGRAWGAATAAWPTEAGEAPIIEVPSSRPSTPAACDGWVRRCLAGADAAEAQSLGRFWPRADCNESAKLSCANRAKVWASPSLALPPRLNPDRATPEDIATAPSGALVLFLPGTGTPPDAVSTLLQAAADMGHHVLGLSYASLPIPVSLTDLWCTRPGADAAACNVQLHEGVLFGREEAPGGSGAPPSDDETGNVWPVPPEESVAALAASALRDLGWTQFLRDGNQTVAWERVVVAGHSQGAGHAAYLSVARPVRAAVLFSGPQEGTQNGRAWIGGGGGGGAGGGSGGHRGRGGGGAGGGAGGGGGRGDGGERPVRRAAFGLHEECGDSPYAAESYCATLFPGLLRKNLRALGLQPGLMGNASGFVVLGHGQSNRLGGISFERGRLPSALGMRGPVHIGSHREAVVLEPEAAPKSPIPPRLTTSRCSTTRRSSPATDARNTRASHSAGRRRPPWWRYGGRCLRSFDL